jgi:hypothetical protein
MLTESQKNYIALFMLGGTPSENELRMFLAKSGWDIGSIDAAVKYSGDNVLTKTVVEVSLKENVATEAPIMNSEAMPKIDKVILNESISTVVPTNPATDIYKEIPVLSVPLDTANSAHSMVIENSIEITKKEQDAVKTSLSNIDDLSLYHTNPLNTTSVTQTQRNTMADIVPVNVMPQVEEVNKKTSSHILHIIIWILVFVLVAAIAAVLGYMYYSGTGIFSNLTYTKIQ